MSSLVSKLVLILAFYLAALPFSSLAQVSGKSDRLDRIILLMAVSLDGKPVPLPGPGVSGLVVYGAISAEAAVAGMEELIRPLDRARAKSIRFAPVSYRYLLGSAETLSSKTSAVTPLLLPDPRQVAPAEKLYLQQGLSADRASELSRAQPTVFCPEPAVYAEVTTSKGVARRIIPCSFDYQRLRDILNPSSPTSLSATAIVAMPWKPFIALIESGAKSYLDDIEVLLSTETQKAIQRTRDERQFLKRD